MKKYLTLLCMLSVALVIGSAGALELATIGIGQAIAQMSIGTVVFAATSNILRRTTW